MTYSTTSASQNLPIQTAIVFIDGGVEESQSLVAGVIPGIRVVLLDSNQDGVEQITEVLRQEKDIASVHIISHGAPGCLQLGNSQLSLDTLDLYSHLLQTWFPLSSISCPFSPNLLLYGCHVAAGDAGAEFLDQLHQRTGAEIAASAKRTGSAALGGDWKLELATPKFAGGLALTSEGMAGYGSVLPIGVSDIKAFYKDLDDDTSGDYSIEGAVQQSGTIYNHKFQVGTQNDLLIYGFSVGGNNYSLSGLVDELKIRRVDNTNDPDPVSGDRSVIWFEREELSGQDLSVKPSLATSMEDVLLSRIINRGTDNIFGNTGNDAGNNNNIERVDFISNNGLSAPTGRLDEFGFLILERNGNDRFKIAAITDIDGSGNPTQFGPGLLVTNKPNEIHWEQSSFILTTEVMRQDPVSDSDLRYTDSVTNQPIAGLFFSYSDLGISEGQEFYGYALFPPDLESTNFLNLNNSSLETNSNRSSQGGLDLIGGGGVFVLNDPPEIDLDNSNTSSANYTQTFTPGSGGVNIADSDVAVTDVETNAPETTSGKEILSATITLTNRPDGNSAESLSLTTAVTNIVNDNNLTSSYNASTGELTINGPADLSVYESIIAGILYNNTEADPDTTSRIIEVVVNDGVENSNTAISTITFATPSNNPPTTSDESAETDEDAPYTFEESDFPFNDADGSDTLQTVKITSLPNNGKLQLNGVDVMDEDEISVADIQNGLLKFVPDPDENGTDYADFTFQVSDGQDFSSDRTFTIDVEPVNDEPTFSGLDNNPTFTPSGSAVILDSSVMVSDPELDSDPTNNYDGATLTLERDGGASDDDVFSNTGTLDPLTESGDLIVNDTIVGTVTTNNGGTLVLSFNNNATQALVNQVLQQITYANSSETPPNSVQLNYRFNDGNTGAQGSGDDSDGMGSIVVNIGSTTPGVETPPSGGSTPPTDPAVTSTPEPEITVSYSGSNDIPDGTSIPQNLGSHPVGDPIIETFTIENTGTADLVLDPGSLNLPNGFTLLGEFPESIDPGSSATFSVQLDTSTPGTFNGAIAFTTNDADEGTFDFPVEVVIAETPPEAAPNRPAVPVVSVTSVPPGPTESAIVPHADDDCCCPMAPTLEGVLVQPIAPFTLTALPDIDRVLLGTENHDSLLGGPVNDAIGGLAGNDRLDGFDGEDLLVGGLSSPVPVGSQFDRDTLYGNRGNDVILGNEGTDRIEAGQDDDVVFGGKDGDRIEGEMGDDTLLGEQGDDEILGGTGDDDRLDSGRDRIYGGDGNDRLYGNQGSDAISGGDGDDRLYGGKDGDLLAGDLGNDTLKGEQGNDTLLGSLGSTNAIGNAGEKDWLSGNEGNDLIKGGEGEDTIYAGQDNDLAYGGKDNDRLYGDKGRDTLSGDLGDDTLFGGTQDPNDSEGISDGDLIFGGDGNDRLNGNRGNDSLVGGSGNDTASGGQEDDVLWGEAGNDWLYGDLGHDKLCGGDGNDTLIGSNGDPMNPEDGNDQLCGGAGNDRLYGNEGDDRLSGDAGEDGLYGGKGNDTLSGGDGTDVLSGEEGNDLLTGGAGGDRFDFAIGHGINTITDFTDGEDVIGLKGGFTFQELAIVQVENDTQITVGTLSITVQGVNANAISSEDFAIV